MLRKKLYLILLIVAAIAVGVYFLCFPSGKYRFVNQEIILNDCDGEDCAEVSINYLLCKSPRDFAKIFNDSLQRQLIRKLIAKDTLMDVEEAGNLFLSQYKSDKQQFEGITPYQIQIVDTITFQNHSLVSLQRSGSEYLGGAHPIDWITYWNFKPTGEVYTQEDLFTDKRKILDLAEKYFRKTFNLSANQELKDGGFVFQNDIFALPKNIGFDKDNLILLYNPYEIAPYSTGIMEVKIPLNEVIPWLSFNLKDEKK